MTIRFAAEQDKDPWNNFVVSSPEGSFLQSWAWGELQEKMGLKIWRLVAPQNLADGKIAGQALIIQRPLSLGKSWLYVPRGPAFATGFGEAKPVWDNLQKKLVEIGEKEGAIFLRIDPAWTEIPPSLPLSREGRWRKSEREVQPRNTLVLDLEKTEEELLAAMHQKTRYNIRLAEKKGVQVRFSTDVNDVEHFLRLAREAHGRGKFSYHPDDYYRAVMELLGDGSPVKSSSDDHGAARAELALAEYGGEVLAVHIVIYFGNTATYAHGASSSKLRDVMAPPLLQWETIKRAKARGYKQYDFFGVAPEGSGPKHPWAGVTRFKLGFGGRRVDYIGAYDLILSEGLYALFNAARRFRSMMR